MGREGGKWGLGRKHGGREGGVGTEGTRGGMGEGMWGGKWGRGGGYGHGEGDTGTGRGRRGLMAPLALFPLPPPRAGGPGSAAVAAGGSG